MLKKIFYIQVDEDVNESHTLYLKLGQNHFTFAITDESGRHLKELGYYSGDVGDIDTMFQENPGLNHLFPKVVVCYDHPQSTLLDAGKEFTGAAVLKTLFGINGNSIVLSEPVSGFALANVYSIPKHTHESLLKKFRNLSYCHSYSIGLQIQSPDPGNASMLVDIRTDEFSLIVVRNKELLLAQTFSYATPADVLYFLLRTCQQFELSQQSVQLRISGLIDKESALYKEIYQYFLEVEFRESAWNVQESPSHFFTSLNDVALCGS
jgi:hypothetical protein